MKRWHGRTWVAREQAPRVTLELILIDGINWVVCFDGHAMWTGRAASERAAKRAAERWVESFARELLVAGGKESP